MVTGLLGKKVGMTRMFCEDGQSICVTLLEAGPCTVVQRKTQDTDDYEAVQLGFAEIKESRANKPMRGHFAKAGTPPTRFLREFPVEAASTLKAGDHVRVDIFQAGELVDVSGVSKGKGFAGLIKRHHFHGGPGAHGSMFHRAPGSIGTSADPSHVLKGRPMAGHMGACRATVQNIKVVRVDAEKNLLVLEGSIPGPNGALVEVKKTVKGSK